MDKVCKHFDKDFDFFTEGIVQNNNCNDNKGNVIANYHGTVNLGHENILDHIKKLIEENNFLREENKKLKK